MRLFDVYAKFESIVREITYFEMMKISVIRLFVMYPRDTIVANFSVLTVFTKTNEPISLSQM